MRYEADYVSDYGVKYDYGSAMHYSSGAFSKNGEKTIVCPAEQEVMVFMVSLK